MSLPTAMYCSHRTAEIQPPIRCLSCSGRVAVKVFGCQLHDECVLRKDIPGIKCCATCVDRNGHVGTQESRQGSTQ